MQSGQAPRRTVFVWLKVYGRNKFKRFAAFKNGYAIATLNMRLLGILNIQLVIADKRDVRRSLCWMQPFALLDDQHAAGVH